MNRVAHYCDTWLLVYVGVWSFSACRNYGNHHYNFSTGVFCEHVLPLKAITFQWLVHV